MEFSAGPFDCHDHERNRYNVYPKEWEWRSMYLPTFQIIPLRLAVLKAVAQSKAFIMRMRQALGCM